MATNVSESTNLIHAITSGNRSGADAHLTRLMAQKATTAIDRMTAQIVRTITEKKD